MNYTRYLLVALLSLWVAPWAHADAASAQPQGLTPFIPLVVIFGIFYFLVIRPQQKRTKQQEKFLGELKRGEMIVTNSGIIGTIRTLSDRFATLEVDEGVCLKVLRSHILESAGSLKEEKQAKTTVATQTQE